MGKNVGNHELMAVEIERIRGRSSWFLLMEMIFDRAWDEANQSLERIWSKARPGLSQSSIRRWKPWVYLQLEDPERRFLNGMMPQARRFRARIGPIASPGQPESPIWFIKPCCFQFQSTHQVGEFPKIVVCGLVKIHVPSVISTWLLTHKEKTEHHHRWTSTQKV